MNSHALKIMFFPSCLLSQSTGFATDLPEQQNWTSFRNGGLSTASGSFLTEWTESEGIAWQRELVGYGQSTPVIFEDKIYLTSVVGPMKEVCRITCLNLHSGKEIWSGQFDSSTQTESNYMHSRAAPTPVVDADGVYAFFEGGDFVAYSHSGEMLWQQNLSEKYGPFQNNHGLGSSPAQTSDLIFLNLEHRGPSSLIAIEKPTGLLRWQVERPSGNSWTSPIIVHGTNESSVVISSSGSITSYNTESGTKLWEIDGVEGNSVPSPTFDGAHLLIGSRLPEFGSTAEAARSNFCLQLQDDRFDVRWRADKVVSDYASPVIAANCVYYLNKVGVLSCLDLATGRSHYTKRLGVECWATPLVAEGHLYFFGKSGETVVIKAGWSFERVATNQLWDVTNPPKPETYLEHQKTDEHDSSGGGRRSGMVATLLKGDANNDGILAQEEVPDQFKAMFPRVDLNADGTLDAEELKLMEESFRKRREGSQEGARDPIVYGIAAADGTIVVRTGTRVYAIRETEEVKP